MDRRRANLDRGALAVKTPLANHTARRECLKLGLFDGVDGQADTLRCREFDPRKLQSRALVVRATV